MSESIKVEVCACTKCSMVGTMEILQDITYMQSELTDAGDLRYNIDLMNICRPDLHEQGVESPLVFVDGEMYDNTDAATIMEAIAVKTAMASSDS